nr:hypothetical protein GCM10020093_047040 [Planobispora longispora]
MGATVVRVGAEVDLAEVEDRLEEGRGVAGPPVPCGPGRVASGSGEAVPVGLEEEVGVPTSSTGSIGGQEGGGAAPFLPSAAPRGPIVTSSKTPLCSTSRTPNQAIEIAMTVAPNHTAMKPSVCRMR